MIIHHAGVNYINSTDTWCVSCLVRYACCFRASQCLMGHAKHFYHVGRRQNTEYMK